MVYFQTSAAAVDITRNGLTISVRSSPRPKTCRLSSTAMPTPKISDSSTGATVNSTVCHSAVRKIGSWNAIL